MASFSAQVIKADSSISTCANNHAIVQVDAKYAVLVVYCALYFSSYNVVHLDEAFVSYEEAVTTKNDRRCR